jgi:hypothetical protein
MSSVRYLESQVHYFLGYFTTGHRMTQEELEAVQGRTWEESVAAFMKNPQTLMLAQHRPLRSIIPGERNYQSPEGDVDFIGSRMLVCMLSGP